MRYSRMLDVVLSNRFKKDLKLAAKRGLDLDALNAIVDQLAAGQPLPANVISGRTGFSCIVSMGKT